MEPGVLLDQNIPPQVRVFDGTIIYQRAIWTQHRPLQRTAFAYGAVGPYEQRANEPCRPPHVRPLSPTRPIHKMAFHHIARRTPTVLAVAVIVGDQRVAPPPQQIHAHAVVPSRVAHPPRVLPSFGNVAEDAALEPHLLLGDTVGDELGAKLAVVELVAKPRQNIGRAYVDAHVEVVPRQRDGAGILLEEDGRDGGRGVAGFGVPEEDAVVVRRVEGQEEVVRGGA
mmetsp:Transcript_36271/g.77340  ORF Transcript_36271/g.77340 Transcript_36271/m.77340 type:complete len:226 (-) Transcript_36271:922-1599(-)